MKASSERHAAALGAHFAGEERSAIVFSQADAVPTADGVGIKILAKLGDVSENPNFWGLLGVLPNKPSVPARSSTSSRIPHAPARKPDISYGAKPAVRFSRVITLRGGIAT